ncbi:hypothetical protein KSK55_09240 [Methanospirillum purgamenti]|uniref:Uncharacterized protein n=1 Tax=Methanospirillum hungatei TaxID=2203 RepID=A0A8F5VKP5_METHU|nr:hypothetical protein [Methanospirillum hungatei]QXO93563.1 hypothetical protein KSK55_09240 [Methanospirillum hungatei]
MKDEYQKRIDIIELLLHVMYMSLFQQYMRVNYDGAWRVVKEIIDSVRKCKGVFVVNWHNTNFRENYIERKVLEKILVYCEKKPAYMETPLLP